MGRQPSPPTEPPPRGPGARWDATAFADTMVWAWKDINAALTPLVGQGGVAALYHRSLHLTAKLHPWLAVPPAGIKSVIDLDALHTLLGSQSLAEATAGGEAFLGTFHELIASLIGLSLTERLLFPVWDKYMNASPEQDPSP
ncbi:MAG: hypothetical protein H7337_00620 [Rhizobacter sp.]|nr:hypothetical protein [Rhizobacter sp.]